MDDIAELVTDPGFLWASVAAIMVFATIVTLTVPMMGADKLDKRIKSVQNRREELRRKSREAIEKGSSKLRGQEKRTLTRQIVESLNLQKLFEDPAIKDKLTQAGFRGNGPVMTFYFFRLAAPILLFIGAALYLMFVNDFGLPNITRWCAALGLGMLGYYAPNLYVTNAAQKRRESIMTSFPDALDLLLICVESGMSLEAAFKKVAVEIGVASPQLAEELVLTNAELSYLQERRKAFENLASRTGLEGVKSVTMALIQAERYGTPIAHALRVLAQENRDMRMAEAEKKAAALPPKLTVPMILFFLPVLFAVIMGPAMIQIFAIRN